MIEKIFNGRQEQLPPFPEDGLPSRSYIINAVGSARLDAEIEDLRQRLGTDAPQGGTITLCHAKYIRGLGWYKMNGADLARLLAVFCEDQDARYTVILD